MVGEQYLNHSRGGTLWLGPPSVQARDLEEVRVLSGGKTTRCSMVNVEASCDP